MKRLIIVLVFIMVYGLVVGLLSEDSGGGTSFSPKGGGTMAFFELLHSEGLPVKKWLYPFSALNLEERGATMVIVSPKTEVFSSKLPDWIEAGNRLVVFHDNKGLFGERLEPNSERSFSSSNWHVPLSCEAAGGWGNKVGRISDSSRVFKKADCEGSKKESCESVWGELSGVYARAAGINNGESGSGIIFKSQTLGAGEIFLFSGNETIINDNIDKHGNLKVLYQLLQDSSSIYFDEFHHGYTLPQTEAAKSQLANLWMFLGLLATALIVGVLSRGARFGKPILEQLETPSANLSFVEATAELYHTHSINSALGGYLDCWKKRLGTRLSLSTGLEDREFIQAAGKKLALSEHQINASLNAARVIRGSSDGEIEEFSNEIGQLEQLLEKSSPKLVTSNA